MVGRRVFGSYCRADANGDSRDARVRYRLGRAAAVLARAVQYECHQRARVSFGRHVGGHGRAVGGVLRPGHRDSAGHVLLRRAAQPLPDREFHPISQPADPVLCDRAPAARSGARAGLCGVHGDLGRHRGVFVRRNSGVLGAVEKADAVMNNLPGTIAGLANTK